MANSYENLRRCLKLQCLGCGQSGIFQGFFQVKPYCSACKMNFEREEGYFVGAIYANVFATELFVLALYLVGIFMLGKIESWMEWTLGMLAVLLPLLFFHHSWSMWLLIDYILTGKEKVKPLATKV
jgi:uncharacterized protein (DUF983 family)